MEKEKKVTFPPYSVDTFKKHFFLAHQAQLFGLIKTLVLGVKSAFLGF